MVRDEFKQLLGATCYWHAHSRSSEMAEAQAAVDAICFVKDSGLRRIIFEGDSVTIISKWTAQNLDRLEVSPLIWRGRPNSSQRTGESGKLFGCLVNFGDHG